MQSTTMLFVPDVEATSKWYQNFLGVDSGHGGPEFEMLLSEGNLFLQLHLIEPGHHDHEVATDGPLGHGVVVVIYVNDAETLFHKARSIGLEILLEFQFNEVANMHEFVVRDLNGYSLMICQTQWDKT
ncbi:MAG: VOC family protein [Pseudomonadota bacterium]